jgi:hypothetical protein
LAAVSATVISPGISGGSALASSIQVEHAVTSKEALERTWPVRVFA